MARDTNFYYSFVVLPAEKRRAIIAVWDFCRAVDDAVDRAEKATGAVAAWRRELEACFGGSPQTPQGQRLQPYIGPFNLPRRAFEDLIDGIEMDLVERRYATFADLREYCLRVASAVGLICLEIFGYEDARARDYAVELGIALQLTNIIRDVGEDLRGGRLYLPTEDLARFGCTVNDLEGEAARAPRPRSAQASGGNGRLPERVASLLKFECDRARDQFARAAAALPRHDRRKLVAAEIMGAVYFAILRRIEREGYDVFSRTVRVPRPRRALIAALTWARVMFLPPPRQP
jgi:phytoene synthase